MDTGAQDFYKELRVYARNSNGQDFLTTYNSVGVTTGGGGGGGGSSLTCNTESGWDDLADGGAGRPISPHSFADFEAVVVDCGTAIQFTASDLEGVSFSEGQTEVITFNAGGAGVYSDFDGDIAFTWTVETATAGHNYVVVEGSVDTLSFRETRAIIGLSGAPGTGTVYTFRAYSEQTNYSAENPMVRGTGTDGEIWGGTMTQQ